MLAIGQPLRACLASARCCRKRRRRQIDLRSQVQCQPVIEQLLGGLDRDSRHHGLHQYAFTRRHEAVELLVLGNFSGDEVPLDFPDWAGAEVLVGEPGDALGPWEGRVYRRATRRE